MFESSLRKPFTLQLEGDKQAGRHHPFPTKLNKSNPEATACEGAKDGASVVGISVSIEVVGAIVGASLGEFVVGETLGAALVDNAIVGTMGGIAVVDGITDEMVVTGASRL